MTLFGFLYFAGIVCLQLFVFYNNLFNEFWNEYFRATDSAILSYGIMFHLEGGLLLCKYWIEFS